MTKLSISERIINMKVSATLGMAQAAQKLKDAGVEVKVLSAGEPNFNTPSVISAVAKQSIDAGKVHYTPVRGTKNIISAMQEKFKRDQGVDYDEDQLMCTVGAKSAIMMALDAVANEGDEVIVFAPYWVSYFEQVKLARAVPVVVNCQAQNNFMPSAQELKAAITSKTKAIILNSPNNPSGGVISLEQLTQLADVLKDSSIWLISDEIYEKLLFDGHKHYSPAAINNDMYKRTILISGASKGYAMTGWRVGFVGACKEIISAMNKLQGQQTTCLPEFIQDAAAYALREDEHVRNAIKSMNDAYLERRDVCLERFKTMPQIKVFKPQGAFYIWADYSQVIKQKKLKDDIELGVKLLEEAHVAMVPGTPFGGPGSLRMSIASSMNDINQAIDHIEKWINS
ncbi:MAG: pyridoxal phosphate-dependent aminotransferase [Myxococcales bacterium]|nr:pyridoxal phosphate-dependent aminotransferase [Myxococcales bacterium]USN51179.1 MAG: pyridoxal phosphate-dependent aminotransferase [Myxococcales bacterium]